MKDTPSVEQKQLISSTSPPRGPPCQPSLCTLCRASPSPREPAAEMEQNLQTFSLQQGQLWGWHITRRAGGNQSIFQTSANVHGVARLGSSLGCVCLAMGRCLEQRQAGPSCIPPTFPWLVSLLHFLPPSEIQGACNFSKDLIKNVPEREWCRRVAGWERWVTKVPPRVSPVPERVLGLSPCCPSPASGFTEIFKLHFQLVVHSGHLEAAAIGAKLRKEVNQ